MANRREFLKMGACAATASLAAKAGAYQAKHASLRAGSKPNMILILADDMGFSDIGCFGSEVSTPNLDRLAKSGIRINQFYNNPRCCPSRASIMTGLYSQQADMGMMVADHGRYPFPQYSGELNAQTPTIPEILKTVGYNTAMVGKWHLATEDAEGKHDWPLQRGFDKFWGMISGASVYYESPHLMDGNTPLPPPSDEHYLTDIWTDHAVSYVEELSREKKPFFLYMAYNAPHWPIQAPEDLIKKYADRYASGWDELRKQRHQKQMDMGLVSKEWPLSPRDPRVPAWKDAKDKDWEMRRMAVYAAMIDRLDQGIGRILDSVERAGIADNTLIVFMSDNGGNSEELARGKRTTPPPSREGKLHGTNYPGQPAPCEIGMTCAGNVPGVMPGDLSTFQSIGIPWGNCANTPFRMYKHYTQEGGISSPFIASWPAGISARGKIVNAVGHETDLMPTFLELAGATFPSKTTHGSTTPLVGESLTPLFAGKSRRRAPIYWEHEGNRAIRDGKWKLVARFTEPWSLYDMEADRTELHDLSAQQPQRTKAMAKMWEDWAKRIGVQPWPMPQTPPREASGKLAVPEYLRQGTSE